LLFPFIKKTRPLYAVLTGTLLVNVSYVLYWLNVYAAAGYTYSPDLSSDPVVLAVSVINLIGFLYVLVLMWDELKGRSWLKIDPIKIGGSAQKEEKENEHQDRPQ
jgi:hypothetical protein